jgi:hypothetical protein
MKILRPESWVESVSGAGAADAAASQSTNSDLGSATMSSAIFACWRPQNSAQLPAITGPLYRR